jgi:hypothetical protein
MRHSTDIIVGSILEAASSVAWAWTIVCKVTGEDFGAAWKREVL